jgi:cation:H+ antiporter
MIISIFFFCAALFLLLISARFFTKSAESLGEWLGFPSFVIGVFIVGIGTSLPELISGIIAVQKGSSEIVPGNIIGANISNILLITSLVAVLNRKEISLSTNYLYVDLHFLVGSFMYFVMISYNGWISFKEAFIGLFIFVVYALYLIKGEQSAQPDSKATLKKPLPLRHVMQLLIACGGIYLGAEYTVESLTKLAGILNLPSSIVALTLLSLGTTLPELAVNISAIQQGKAEMALGNVLGSCIFNSLVIPPVVAMFGQIAIPANLLNFPLPTMAASGLLFYLLTQDKRISIWEGWLLICLFGLFILQISGI